MEERYEQAVRETLKQFKSVEADLERQLEPPWWNDPVLLPVAIFALLIVGGASSLAGKGFWIGIAYGFTVCVALLLAYGLWRLCKWLSGLGVEQIPTVPAETCQDLGNG